MRIINLLTSRGTLGPVQGEISMASTLSVLPLLRQAAPRLSRQFFTCQATREASVRSREVLRISKNSAFLRAFRSSRTNASTASLGHDVVLKPSSSLSSLSKTIRTAKDKKSTNSFFPETSDKVVAYWLLGSAASVFGIVVFGGLTRLTESGY